MGVADAVAAAALSALSLDFTGQGSMVYRRRITSRDPVLQESTGDVDTDYPVRGYADEDHSKFVNGRFVREDEAVVYVAGSDLAITPSVGNRTETQIQEDQIVYGGKGRQVLDVQAVRMGDLVVLWQLIVKR